MRTKSSLGFITDSLRVTAPKFPILQLYKLTMFFTPRCPGGHETGRRAKWSSSHLEAPLTGQNMMAWPLQLISDPIRGFKYWDAKPTCPIMPWHFFPESLWCKLAWSRMCSPKFLLVAISLEDLGSHLLEAAVFFRNSRHKGCCSAKVAPPSCIRSILIYVVVSFFFDFSPWYPGRWSDLTSIFFRWAEATK